MPQVSIVIVCMNHPDNLVPCLESLQRHTTVSHDIWVVAYLFDKGALARLQADFPEVHWVLSDEVRGFAENNNLALRQVTGEWVLCINDDTQIFMPTVDRLVRDFALLPENAAILSPKIVFPNGETQTCGRPKQTACQYVLERYHLADNACADDTRGKKPVARSIFPTSDINGACFMIRREVFAELGWFDERYFFTPEDIALSTLARRKGYGIYVDADVTVVHYHHKTAQAVITATKPAGMRGFLMFHSRGCGLYYFLLGCLVGCAEGCKFCWAALRCLFCSRKELRVQRMVYAHNLASIFTTKTPKEIFLKYYSRLP